PPGSIVAIYGYGIGYFLADTIQHGKAYWVKTSRACTIKLAAAPNPSIPPEFLTDRAKFRNDELPPPPPGEGPEVRTPQPSGEVAATLPQEFGLSQNYPNPFNPSTLIRYSLPAQPSGGLYHVRIRIFNVVGQQVAELVNEDQTAGYKTVEWNASGLPTGLYYYRLNAGSFDAIKKLLLVK